MKRLLLCALLTFIAGPAFADAPPDGHALADWVFLDADGHQNLSGSSDDVAAARAVQHHGEPLFYFHRDGKAAVIRDAATLARLRAAWAPASALGERMGKLGDAMGAVGTQQGAIGTKMGVIGGKLGTLGVRLGDRRLDDQERARIETEMNALQHQMEPLQRDLDALQAKMEPLSAQLNGLDQWMEPLVVTAQRATAAIVDDAQAHGLVLDAK